MDPVTSGPPVVVGIDGSAFALAAVRWAADEAAHQGARLRVVHANLWSGVPGRPARAPSRPGRSMAQTSMGQRSMTQASMTQTLARPVAPPMAQHAKLLLDTALAVARRHQPRLAVTGAVVPARPIELLIEESARARLVVLGARGAGGFAELLAGAVAVGVTAHAHCPVAVVRGATEDAALPTEGSVVAGVDGSPHSTPALRFAFDSASRLSTPLVALHTWVDMAVELPAGAPAWAVDWNRVQDDEQRLLAERLAGWQEEYPEVQVHRLVTRDRPVRSLLRAAAAAQLVVVGSRGRGGFAGMLLGSTSHALLHHCPCPLVVVRDA